MKHRREIIYVVVSLLAGIVLAAILTEASYRFQTQAQDRNEKQIILIIPLGTGQLIENGQPSPSIPKDMVFIVGDQLLVKNEDVVDHQLGPLFIPKGASASLTFTQVGNLAYACSFLPDKYLGLDIKAPLNISTRILGILSAGLPMGILFALYIVFAIRPGLAKEAKNK